MPRPLTPYCPRAVPASRCAPAAHSRRPSPHRHFHHAPAEWSPSHNENSAQHTVHAGDELYGSITYRPTTDSYDVYHKNLADGWDITMNIPVQKIKGVAKNYTIGVWDGVVLC